MKPKFEIAGQIDRPVAEVFEAVVDPDQLSGYFTTNGAKGRMRTGATVRWAFPEIAGDFPVEIIEVIENERIVLEWDADPTPGLPDGVRTRTTMTFEALDNGRTLVTIAEEGWPESDAGFTSSYSNCGGWMHMLCCLKAKLEYDIRLRDGMWI